MLCSLFFFLAFCEVGWTQNLLVYDLNEHDTIRLVKGQAYYWQINNDSIFLSAFTIDANNRVILRGHPFDVSSLSAISEHPFSMQKNGRYRSVLVPGITLGAVILAAMITAGTEADEAPENWIFIQVSAVAIPVLATHFIVKKKRKKPDYNLRKRYLLEISS